MVNAYLAKSYPVGKTINNHTEDLIKLYKLLKSRYPGILSEIEWKILLLAIFHHDIGKINASFQNKIYMKNKQYELLPDDFQGNLEIPHGWISTCMLDYNKIQSEQGLSKDDIRLLAMAIYYHHHRKQEFTDEQLAQFLQKNTKPYIQAFRKTFISNYISEEPDFEHINTKVNLEKLLKNKGQYLSYIKVKGLLNRIDYTASAEIDEIEKSPYDTYGEPVDMKVINKYTTSGNKLNDVQLYLLKNRDKNIILTASTGIGKTEGALLWLGTDKGFYTLPLRVTINAIYNRIKRSTDNNCLNYSPALLLHSDSQKQYLLETQSYEDSIYMNSEARLFTSPLTITTVDQIFRFVFRYHGYEMIPATLMYSKVIIDEIQMYTPSIIACILYGLREITRLGGKFLVMTATMPKIFIQILKDKLKVDMPETYEMPEPFLRESNRTDKAKHFVKLLDSDINLAQIEKEALHNKVLLIVNTVHKAQDIFDKIKAENKQLFHSLYTRKHRDILEHELINFSKNPDAKGVWITTQIVEASLDIDFDILHTEMCTIDSLFQRMGRILRGRDRFLKHQSPNVYVYTKQPTGIGNVIDPEIYRYSLNALKKALNADGTQILTEVDKQNIISNVYDPEKNPKILNSQYYKKIVDYIDYLISIQIRPYEINKEDVDFRNILSELVIPSCIYNELDKTGEILRLENELKVADKVKRHEILNEILKHTIQVSYFYDKDLLSNISSTLLYEANKEVYSKNGIKLCDCPYDFNSDKKKGLGLVRKITKDEKNIIQSNNSQL